MGLKQADRELDMYSDIAQSYNELHGDEQVRKISLILQHFPIYPEEKLLDVGCGTGISFDYWPARDVSGVEPSMAMITQASKEYQNKIFHLRAEDLSIFDNQEFDVVASITAIHNFTDVEAGLKEMKRVGNRRFVFSVLKRSANFEMIDHLIRSLFNVKKRLEDKHDRIYLIL